MIQRFFATLILLLITSNLSFSQNAQALEFKGIPVQGTLDVFVSQLVKKGYEKLYGTETGTILTGNFVGDEVNIFVLSSSKTKTVWKVKVVFPEKKSWTSLKSQYSDIKELYNKKYSHDVSYEFFIDPYYEGDGYELSAFKQEKAHYNTFYKEGILIEIDDNARLSVSYENSSNAKIALKEREANILKEI